MVLTRSQNSPRKPPTPGRKRKVRSKRFSESDDDCDIELKEVRESLSENLETIREDNEEIDENMNDIKDVTVNLRDINQKQFQILGTSKADNKIPIKILDTISEESLNDDDITHELEPQTDVIQIVEEPQCSNSSTENSESCISKTPKKHRFYFPPAKTLVPKNITPTSIEVGLEMQDIYIDVKSAKGGKKKMESLFAEVTMNKKDSQLIDSVITPDLETKLAVPAEKSVQQQRRERKEQLESSAGKDWFNMKPPEMTNDVKRDLKILNMRGILDPKRFYKHNDRQALPRYFQVGKVMDSPADFYSSRVPKKQRKPNLTEELLADAQFQQYQKRKYNEIQMKKKALGAKHRRLKRGKFSKKNKESLS